MKDIQCSQLFSEVSLPWRNGPYWGLNICLLLADWTFCSSHGKIILVEWMSMLLGFRYQPCCWVLPPWLLHLCVHYGQLCGRLIDAGPYVIALQHIPLLQMNKWLGLWRSWYFNSSDGHCDLWTVIQRSSCSVATPIYPFMCLFLWPSCPGLLIFLFSGSRPTSQDISRDCKSSFWHNRKECISKRCCLYLF